MRLTPLLLLLAAASAFAQSGPSTNYLPALTGPGTAGTTYHGIPGPWMAGRTGPSTSTGSTGYPYNINQTVTGPGPKGSMTVTGRTPISSRNAAARAIARGLPLVGTALAFKDIYDALRCRPGGPGFAECDQGQPTVQVAEYEAVCLAVGRGSTGTAACEAGLALATSLGHNNPSQTQTACSSTGALQTFLTSWIITTPTGSDPRQWRYMRTRSYGSPIGNCVGSPVVPAGTEYRDGFAQTESSQKCPPDANGNRPTPSYTDGRCATGNYGPSTEDDVYDKARGGPGRPGLRDADMRTKMPGLVDNGVPAGDTPPVYAGPDAITGDRSTTQNPDGSTTVRDRDFPMEYFEGGYKWRERIIEFTVPPGMPVPAPGTGTPGIAPPGTSPGPITNNPAPEPSEPQEDLECGIPGYPPCKMDETGTPTTAEPLPDPEAIFDPLSVPLPPPDLPWSWTFQLPSGCGPISAGVFAGHTVQIDICQWQGMIHSIMTMVWSITFVFAAISIVTRTLASD